MEAKVVTKKHHGERCVSVWLPDELAQRLDGHLTGQIAGLVGARPSRQAFVLDAIERALDDARATQGATQGATR